MKRKEKRREVGGAGNCEKNDFLEGKKFFLLSNFPRILGFCAGLKFFSFLFYASGKCFTAIVRSRAERVGAFNDSCSSAHPLIYISTLLDDRWQCGHGEF